MALTQAPRGTSPVRMDGATMGERITHRLDVLMGNLEAVQDCIDTMERERIPIPEYIVTEYQSCADSLEQFADYWGFEC